MVAIGFFDTGIEGFRRRRSGRNILDDIFGKVQLRFLVPCCGDVNADMRRRGCG